MRWSGWLLLPLVMAFLVTGYIMDGRYGFGKLLDEKTALTFHRMFHLPLIFWCWRMLCRRCILPFSDGAGSNIAQRS